LRKSTLDPERYELDEDGLPREIVGPWVREKHVRLEKYIGISSAVRKKFIGPEDAGATFIDLFSGPGRARIKEEPGVIHGSPLVAWKESVARKSVFTQIHIADAELALLEAAETRLRIAGAPVRSELGRATDTIDRVISKLNRHGLHFAFLDPYDLNGLPFEIIRKLAKIKHMDILIHVSVQDLQRNL
jgi:three-Cys-motif partner protein